MDHIYNINYILYLIYLGIPIGLLLCFKFKYNVYGLWFGMCIASFISSIIFIWIRLRTNWKKEVKSALKRIKKKNKDLKQFKYRVNLTENMNQIRKYSNNTDMTTSTGITVPNKSINNDNNSIFSDDS